MAKKVHIHCLLLLYTTDIADRKTVGGKLRYREGERAREKKGRIAGNLIYIGQKE